MEELRTDICDWTVARNEMVTRQKKAKAYSQAKAKQKSKQKAKIRNKILFALFIVALVAGICIVGHVDYESKECFPHNCVAISDKAIKVEKSGNIYPVKFPVNKGEKYIVLFEADNVTPKKVIKKID